LSTFKLISVIKNQILMRRESSRVFFICEPIYGSQNAEGQFHGVHYMELEVKAPQPAY
jgi:hypothetical protein